MQFQTRIPLKPEQPKLDYSSKTLLLGSCFAENIAKKLKYYKFQYTLNPFGIIFHPLVLERLLRLTSKDITQTEVVEHKQHYHSFNAHSKLSSTSKAKLIANLEAASIELKNVLSKASHIVITLGTAWGYVHKDTNNVVANCHKMPQKLFNKKLFSAKEVTKSLKSISEIIEGMNPSAKIIFTVSPVRHIKDGFVENTQSKAHLISAVHQTILETKNTTYFPSFEIMMDELRDYRFYNEDMLHPNSTAISYIWERFTEVWLSEQAKQTIKKVESIQRALDHRPFNPESLEHQSFLQNLQKKIIKLQEEVPQIKF